ncbi:WD40 repeat [Dillenia turbinata]|uniref:WD40 repeat n=1 Tax=Dillenia turbinata TaxID=194707 RepID=A0AAN8W9N2_9MAGN
MKLMKMMNFADPSSSLLAACGGDTVKLFDVSVDPGDPCVLSYSPSPGSVVNSVKWNHTNLVVASAGDDKKISLWRKNGQNIGTVPVSGTDSGDGIEESILAINFSNKGSRYICSGGSGQVVRVWDLQRKRCIKWLKGHTDMITGVMYNCKDEHLASISLSGDLILHNLASGARAAELKDPNGQVLRVLDYSRMSRHLVVTAGDDGSVHLWDTTGRSPKISWLKQHSAPTAGVSFSPSNDKIIASVGLDKKLYTFDSASRRPSFCIPYEPAPFSSLAFREDGYTLAAGTSGGRVVFYDMRGKPQPLYLLRAYGSSEAVTSLCWQRSKPVLVNESNCTPETVLLGGAVEDSILMPDPLPSVTSSSLSVSTIIPSSRNNSHSGSLSDASSAATTTGGSKSDPLYTSTAEETPLRNHLWTGGTLSRLHAPRSYNFKDDMEVFSPLVEVQPITPLDKLWDEHEKVKKDVLSVDKKPSLLLFPSSSRRFAISEEGVNDHPIFDWKPGSTLKQAGRDHEIKHTAMADEHHHVGGDHFFHVLAQTLTDDSYSSFMQLGSTSAASFKSDDSTVISPPEAWGGERLSDRFPHLRQPVNLPSRFGMLTSAGMTAGSMLSGLQDLSVSTNQVNSTTNSSLSYPSLRARDNLSNQDTSLGLSEHIPSSPMSRIIGQANAESQGLTTLPLPRKFSTYAERISTTSSFSDGISLSTGSPKIKKTGAETKELLNSLLSRSETSSAVDSGNLSSVNGGVPQTPRISAQPDLQQGSSFSLQLFQRTLEETLGSFQKSMHGDMRNLHIEILRQFHIQEMDVSGALSLVLQNQAELLKEIQNLRKENQQLRQFLQH